MKQVNRPENRSPFIVTMITFFVALLALTITSGSVFSSSGARKLAPQTTAQESKQTDGRDLKVGALIEREIAGGETHTYRIALTSGQYLHVVVEQKGIDVVVRLLGPDDKQITEVDSPTGAEGPESLSMLAEASAEYVVEVRSEDKGAAAGRYQIKISALREATSTDRVLVAAERPFWEGRRLREQGTAESLRKGIENYNQALPLWREVGDRQREGQTLNEIGLSYASLSEFNKALEYYGQAVPLLRAAGDHREEAITLHNMGMAHWRLGQLREGLEHSSQALALIRDVRDQRQEANILNGIGAICMALGEPQKALEYFNEALPLARIVGDRRRLATMLNNIGTAYEGLGEFEKALENQNQALPLRRAVGDRRGEAITLHNIGVNYDRLGEPREALGYFNQALPLLRTVGDRRGEALTLSSMGGGHNSLGEPQKALEYLNHALSLGLAVGDQYGRAYTLSHISKSYTILGDYQKALEYQNQALSLQQTVGDRRGEAYTLSNIGSSHNSLGEPRKALEYYYRGLQLSRDVGDRVKEAGILYGIARAERNQGKIIEARAQIEAALNIIESTRSRLISQQLRTSFSASSQDYYEFYIDLLMRLHRDQLSAGYDAAALQASERARARSLLEILNEARADIRHGVDPLLLARERSSQQQLNAKSEWLARLLSGKHSEEQETVARKEVETLLTEYQDVEAQIRAKSPRYAALTQPQPLSLKEIQQQVLDEETLLLEYALGEERSYLWIATPSSVTSFELPKRAEIEAAAKQVYEALTARNKLLRFEKQDNKQARVARADAEFFADSAVLSQMLLEPVAGLLGKKRLLIVSDGALQYVPFGALPIPGGQLLGSKNNQDRRPSNYRPLMTEHEIVSLPSASTLAVLRKELADRQRGIKTVAVLADPVFQDDDPRVKGDSVRTDKQANEPSSKSSETRGLQSDMERSAAGTGQVEFRRLPFSRQEAQGIAALTSNAMRKEWLDFEASRITATSAELSNYRIIHFATHGFLNSQHPELSGIVLSLVDEAGRPQDGFMRLHDIYNLKLGADLVVLSACRTALGKEIKGEGLVGLTRGFMYAGAPRVVASLWAVDDEITAELMKKFYREMLVKKQPPVAALRAAQVSIWKEKRLPPYYWAAFVLQGEWK